MRLVIALLVLFAAAKAHAYPQFLYSNQDDRCGQCHLAWAGGGLLADYGRDESSSSISRGGDGRFLHGLVTPPSWLTIGGDFRFATAEKLVAGYDQTLVFPMQMDVNLRATRDKISFAMTVGARGGGARDEPQPKVWERLVSREHYFEYAGDNYFARVGRFFPIYGIKLVDHTSYVRRYMGFGTLEEPYALEVTREFDESELHVTAIAPNPVGLLANGQQGYGGTIAFERRFDDMALGVQSRMSLATMESRYAVGGTAKLWMPEAKLLWLAELDLQRQVFSRGAPGRTQIAGYLAISRWLTKGVMLSGALHLWEPDLTLTADSREAAELTLQYFPRSHFELNLLVRGALEGTNADDPGFLSLLQFHYYL